VRVLPTIVPNERQSDVGLLGGSDFHANKMGFQRAQYRSASLAYPL
jgi:hypothetical protein